MSEKLSQEQVLAEIKVFGSRNKGMTAAVQGFFQNILAPHADHPEVVAFAEQHSIVLSTVES